MECCGYHVSAAVAEWSLVQCVTTLPGSQVMATELASLYCLAVYDGGFVVCYIALVKHRRFLSSTKVEMEDRR